MSISQEVIRSALNAHVDLQLGSYFTDRVDKDEVVLTYSKRVSDFFWNYATLLNVSSPVDSFIQSVEKFYTERDRLPCFYIDPTTKPSDFDNHLEGYDREDEVWMFFRGNKSLPENPELRIIEVNDVPAMEKFVHIFNLSYGGEPLEDGEGYGDLPPEYGQALLAAFNEPNARKKVFHYLGYEGDTPVCIGSLYSTGKHGGIYNVGTVPSHRGKGYGSTISAHAVKKSKEMYVSVLFLQTQEGGSVERLYQSIGFETEFSTSLLFKE